MFTLEQSQNFPISLDEAWAFFSNPRNLALITPPSLGFVITSNPPQDIENDLMITYRVKPLLNIPMTWVSKIKEVQKPHQFVDEQMSGPYAYWHHLHRFKTIPGGVCVEDVVTYAPPMGLLGVWLNPILIAPRLQEIFAFRRNVLENHFGQL